MNRKNWSCFGINRTKWAFGQMGGFFAFMLLCTIISRGIYVYGLAEVVTEAPKRQTLRHTVTGEGSIQKNRELAVHVAEGILVEEIYVKEGDKVSAEKKLLKLNEEDLTDKMESLEAEMEKLRLQIADWDSNRKLEEEKMRREQKRAQEAYELAENLGNENIIDIQNKLDAAKESRNALWDKEAYVRYQVENGGDMVSDESTKVDRERSAGEEWEAINAANEEKVRALEAALDEANKEKDAAIRAAKNQLEDAQTAAKADSTGRIYELEMQQMKKEWKRYKDYINEGGIVFASEEMQITSIIISVGEKTGSGAVILYAPSGEPLDFCMDITKEQAEFVAAGDTVILDFGEGKSKRNDLTVESLTVSSSNADMYELHITVPPGEIKIGDKASIWMEKQTAGYETVVPLSALHYGNGKTYVYVLREEETILGEELVTERIDVTILDQDDCLAALKPGALSDRDRVVTFSDKMIADDEHVRLREQ